MARYVLPPRQKMINLLYIILIAMLAINVSTDVMTGYNVMYASYNMQIEDIKLNNLFLTSEIVKDNSVGDQAAAEVRVAHEIGKETADIITLIDEIKTTIAKSADGSSYRAGELENREDMRAVPAVLLSSGMGETLRKSIMNYRNKILPYIHDESLKKLVSQYLTVGKNDSDVTWNDAFTSLPAIGGIVFFTKLQMDVLQSENALYRSLLSDISIKREHAYLLKDSLYQAYLEEAEKKKTSVLQGSVSARLMNVFYAGIDNPLQITVPGVSPDELSVSATHGTVLQKDGEWVVKPLGESSKCTVALVSTSGGEKKEIGRYDFQVELLPDPLPFISYKNEKGELVQYSGSVPIEARHLLQVLSVGALYENKNVRAPFEVLSFDVVLVKPDNTTLYRSQKGNELSQEQRQVFRQAVKGDKLYITSVNVMGGDGKKREIRPIEIVVN